MTMTCSKCKFVPTSPTTCVHSKDCEDYQSGITAEELTERLGGIQLFMHSDLVLLLKDKTEQVRKPNVLGVGSFEGSQPNYVVQWFYPGVTLQFERANFDHPEFGKVSVYAVQKIEENNHAKRSTKKKSSAGVSRRAVKRNRNSSNKRS